MQKTRKPGADPRQCCSSKISSFKKKGLFFGTLLKKGSPGFVGLCMRKVLQIGCCVKFPKFCPILGLAVVCVAALSVEEQGPKE